MKPLVLALMLMVAAILAAQQPPSQSAPLSQGTPVPEDQRIAADGIDELLADGKVILLDVRESKELEELGTRPGSIHIPLGELERPLDELPKDKTILTA